MTEPNFDPFNYSPVADAIACASKQNAFNLHYIERGRWILVGLAAGLMASGLNHNQVLGLMIREIVKNRIVLHPKCIPPGDAWNQLRQYTERQI